MINKKSENAKNRNIKQLRELLAQPDHRGRVVGPAEIARKLGKSSAWFYKHVGRATLAQEWLAANQDAPVDAKRHYQGMLDGAVAGAQAEVKILTGQGGERREHFVSREAAQAKTVQLGRAVQGVAPVRAVVIQKETEVVPVTPKDAAIERIREAYVLAGLGDMPNVGDLMREFGLIGEDGKPVEGSAIQVTEGEVRLVMIRDDWKLQRRDHLHRALDIIPDEVKLVTMTRNVEVQRILFQQIKLMHARVQEFLTTGQATYKDASGKRQPLPGFTPDPGVIAGMAEVMRRMVDGGGNVNILINQFNQGGEGTAADQISQVTRRYAARLSDMSPDEVRQEIASLEKLATLLVGEGDVPTLDAIEAAEPIEVKSTVEKTEQ